MGVKWKTTKKTPSLTGLTTKDTPASSKEPVKLLSKAKTKKISAPTSMSTTSSSVKRSTGRPKPLAKVSHKSSTTTLRSRSASVTGRHLSSMTVPGNSSAIASKGTLGKAKAKRAPSGPFTIDLGDYVVCTWTYGLSHGVGLNRFDGYVEDIRKGEDDGIFYFTVKNDQGVICDLWTENTIIQKVDN